METTTKKIYLASDFHLGAPSYEESLIREKKIVSWLTHIEDEASEIFLVGDVFDFWFEYTKVVPKGFLLLLLQACAKAKAKLGCNLANTHLQILEVKICLKNL